MNSSRTLAVLIVAMTLIGLIGCGGDGGGVGKLLGGSDSKVTITVSCVRPAQQEIPSNIRRIAIAEFTADNARDASYGQIASDKLSGQLDESNRVFNRYTLVDRINLKKIMDEQDLQIAISDSSSAKEAGKMAKVDGMIFGGVKVRSESVPATRTTFKMGSNGVPMPAQEHYTKRIMTANVSFSLVEVQSGKTLVSKPFSETYDSDKDKGDASFKSMLGLEGKADRKSEMEAANVLIDRCVKQFVNMISPVKVDTKYKLAKGASKAVTRGNTMAGAGDLAGALEAYNEALAENPDDDGACYNAGLVCEAQGNNKGAEEYYTRAIKIKPDSTTYVQARVRVRGAKGGAAAPAGGAPKGDVRKDKESRVD